MFVRMHTPANINLQNMGSAACSPRWRGCGSLRHVVQCGAVIQNAFVTTNQTHPRHRRKSSDAIEDHASPSIRQQKQTGCMAVTTENQTTSWGRRGKLNDLRSRHFRPYYSIVADIARGFLFLFRLAARLTQEDYLSKVHPFSRSCINVIRYQGLLSHMQLFWPAAEGLAISRL